MSENNDNIKNNINDKRNPNYDVEITGVGCDVRVDKVIAYGAASNAENLLQEAGRPMRGSQEETEGKRGYTFVFHKGHLGTYKLLLVKHNDESNLICTF